MSEDRQQVEAAQDFTQDTDVEGLCPNDDRIARRLDRLFEILRQPVPVDSPAARFLAEHPQFGRYRLIRQLGEGAMGLVLLARDSTLDREVALKLPKIETSDPDRLARFQREGRAAAKLRHPNLCTVYDVGEIEGHHFISMAFIEGHPLSEVISAKESPFQTPTPSSDSEAVRIVAALAAALDVAHQNGVVHRDLKPSNIMIDSHDQPIITDFGLARSLDVTQESRVTATGAFVGTPQYMSPEQAQGKVERVDARSDIYSLGVVFYELLTGTVPFRGSFGEVIAKVVTDFPSLPSTLRRDLSPALQAICMKMLEKCPEHRYQSMREVSVALSSSHVHATATTPPPPTVFSEPTVFATREPQAPTGSDFSSLPVKQRCYIVLRWIACAPAAIAAAALVHFVVLLVNTWAMEFNYTNPNSFLGRLWNYAVSSAIFGFVGVSVAVQVAPNHKKPVAFVAAGALLFVSGLAAYPILANLDLWGLFALVCTNLGSIGAAYSIATNESPP